MRNSLTASFASVLFAVVAALGLAPGNASALTASCGCEHLSSVYDNFCEANPQSSETEYRYYFAVTSEGYFPWGTDPESPFQYADCRSTSAGCSYSVTVTVQEVSCDGSGNCTVLDSGYASCGGTGGGT